MSKPKEITRQFVNSTNLKTVGHDKETNTMQVEFFNGAIWNYSPVTEDAYKTMVKSESVGQWFNQNIKRNPDIKQEMVKDNK